MNILQPSNQPTLKPILVTLLLFTCLAVTAQKNERVRLRWKIGDREQVRYQTVMSEIDSSDFDINLRGIMPSLPDSSGKGKQDAKALLKRLNLSLHDLDYVTTLTSRGNDIIEIVMTTKQKETPKDKPQDTANSKEKEFIQMVQSMTQGVVLRGSVNAGGGIHSFWVKTNQKNLLATFFELPSKPVSVGDTWTIEVNLIENDQNFTCDSAKKINEVSLVELRKEGGQTVAVIKYNILEYVEGSFRAPAIMGNDGPKKTMMKFTHQAIAEFSVDRGRWISYNGIMSLDASGVLTAHKKTRLALAAAQNN